MIVILATNIRFTRYSPFENLPEKQFSPSQTFIYKYSYMIVLTVASTFLRCYTPIVPSYRIGKF